MPGSRPNYLLFVVISAALVFMGHFFVLQRQPAGPTAYRTISGDALEYICMIEGNLTCADTPYRYRVLVPLLAKLLPLSAPQALRLISYASLFLTYFVLLLIGSRLGMNSWGSLAGLLLVFTSNVHVYNYHNPYLLDAFQQLALTVMVFALLFDSFWLYGAAALTGVACREAPLLLVPAWGLLNSWRRGLVVFGLAMLVFFLPRLLLPGAGSETMLESFLRRLIWTAAGRSPLLIPVEVFWAWGFIWFPAALGIWLLVKEHFTVLMTWFLLSIVALLASMFFAEDTAREVAILSPVFVISIAQLCTTLITTGRQRWVKLLMTVAVVQLFIALPNVVLGEEVWSVVRWGKVGLLAAGTAGSAGLLFVLRAELKQTVRVRTVELSRFLRARFRFQAAQPVQGS